MRIQQRIEKLEKAVVQPWAFVTRVICKGSEPTEEEQLRIDFFVSIDKPIQPKDKLSISFYDTDYYYTYDYNKSSFHIDGLKQGKWKSRFYTNKGISFYFKTVHPDIYEVIFE